MAVQVGGVTDGALIQNIPLATGCTAEENRRAVLTVMRCAINTKAGIGAVVEVCAMLGLDSDAVFDKDGRQQ